MVGPGAPGVSDSSESFLVGREDEFELGRHLACAPGPRTVVIEGPAGIGKTRLWQAGLEAAGQDGRRVLTTRRGRARQTGRTPVSATCYT